MKNMRVWVWVVFCFAGISLSAQDLTVTDPAWLDPESPPADVIPKFKNRPAPSVADELAKADVFAYGIVMQSVDPKGARMLQATQVSNPYLKDALEAAGATCLPAKRAGKPVTTAFWYAVIFNPRSASPKNKDADPRVLSVAPIAVEKRELPEGAKLPKVVYATLAINKEGELESFSFEDSANEVFREHVGGSLHNWRFAAGRTNGEAAAKSLRVALLVEAPFRPKISVPIEPPKVLYRQSPMYPVAMRKTKLNGQVLVEFMLDEKGKVTAPVVKRSSNPGFNEAAIEAIKAWKFEPARQEGVPIRLRMQQPLDFSITGGRDYASVEKPSRKSQEKMPEAWRYDIPPKPTGVLVPLYPYSQLKARHTGKVLIMLLVGADGKVRESKVVEASEPEFGYAMAAAAEAFTFIPALKEGRPTKTVLRLEQDFSLSGAGSIVPSKDWDLYRIEEKHPETVLEESALDSPLKPLVRNSPIFPSGAQNGERGEATIELLVDTDGAARLPRVVDATEPWFGYAAAEAVRGWRFEPPKAGGKPVVARTRLPFRFVRKKAPTQSVPEAEPLPFPE